jgi:hypothetical protein
MVMTLKGWLSLIGALDFDLKSETINDHWFDWAWGREDWCPIPEYWFYEKSYDPDSETETYEYISMYFSYSKLRSPFFSKN